MRATASRSTVLTCSITTARSRALFTPNSTCPTRVCTTCLAASPQHMRSTRPPRSCWWIVVASWLLAIRGRPRRPSSRTSSIRSWLLRPALPAGRLQHLLVLVFAHFLPALLDYRAQARSFVASTAPFMSRNILDEVDVYTGGGINAPGRCLHDRSRDR